MFPRGSEYVADFYRTTKRLTFSVSSFSSASYYFFPYRLPSFRAGDSFSNRTGHTCLAVSFFLYSTNPYFLDCTPSSFSFPFAFLRRRPLSQTYFWPVVMSTGHKRNTLVVRRRIPFYLCKLHSNYSTYIFPFVKSTENRERQGGP